MTIDPQRLGARERVHVCLIEHNRLAACHLCQILKADPPLTILSESEILGGQDTQTKPVSVFLLDRGTLRSPITKYLRLFVLHRPRAKTLVLDESLSWEEQLHLISLGIQGLLTYPEVDDKLIPGLHAVAQGHLWIAKDVLEEYIAYSLRHSRRKPSSKESFTRRELNIIDFVQRKSSNKEISSMLGISEGTVKFHLTNIFNKLGVRDRHSVAEMTAYKFPGGSADQNAAKS